MQRWQQKRRQKNHHNMVQQARPTIKRYSKSRQKPNLSSSRANQANSKINAPFRQVLNIFQLQKYELLLLEYGFPQRIKDKESISLIDQLIKKVDEEDKDKLYTLMNALLSISSDFKSISKRTPVIKKNKNKYLPPTQQSTNLKKSDSSSYKKSEKNSNFRIKSKSIIGHHFLNQTATGSIEKMLTKKGKARDDSTIIHQFKLKGASSTTYTVKSNKIIDRIQSRLKKIKGYGDEKKQQQKDAKLYFNEIKQMYLSYDTATLTSNIANIDIQQIIQCYAIEILNKINQSPLNPQKTKIIPKNKKQVDIQKLLKESLFQDQKPDHKRQSIHSEISDEVEETISQGSNQEKQDNSQQDPDFLDFTAQSIALDLTCFNYRYEDQLSEYSCSIKDIKNFVQLIMMAGKMEKQTPILSYAYILRLLNVCKRDRINRRNWKNLILITLIEASKIWDDQSLQNHSFSKVIEPYTTLQINRLERHLLTFLNYKLKIEPKEYCQSYFVLRNHATKACKTVHLMRLNLQTIKKLQSGTKKCQQNLKQTYKKKLNQSF